MTLKDQLAWEMELVERGTRRYQENQQRLKAKGEGDKSDGVRYLFQERMQEVADHIEQLCSKLVGRNAKYIRLLRSVVQQNDKGEDDWLKLAYIGLQSAFQTVLMEKKNTVLQATLSIGSRIEADLKCQMFEAKYPAYYHTVAKSLKDQGVTDYAHKHKVFMAKFRDFEDLDWVDFEPEVRSHLGLRVLDAILHVFGDVIVAHKTRRGLRVTTRLKVTPEFDKWITEFENARALLDPTRLPCKIPPEAWDGKGNGGYYLPQMKRSTQFVKCKSRDHRKFVQQHDPKHHRLAVNKLQRTGWQVNEQVLNVQQEIYNKGLGVGLPSNTKVVIPPFPEDLKDIPKDELNTKQKARIGAWKDLAKNAHHREKQRQSAVIAFMQSFRLAQELRSWDKFYYVYTCDFRGRIYCATAGLSPQGADTAKGLLQFAKTERLGIQGIRWLAIQGANTFGEDKLSYDDRYDWVCRNTEHIRQVCDDPIATREWWGSADKPYQFLAFCFEWQRADYGKNPDAHSAIPVGLDGSCNGLQHFSAMLRDSVGATATNLSTSDTPNDIYADVARECERLLMELDHPVGNKWLKVGINRKLAKRPVMTLPYGAKQTSCREYIFEWAMENWSKFDLPEEHAWEYSKWLTPYLWQAISNTVIAARSAMDWLQRNVGKDYAKWVTPIGFPVYQYYKDVEATRVVTQLCGITELKIRDLDRYGDPKKAAQRSGIAPNFVHSIDSTHMVMTINMTDFNSYAMIHDDFGTHAGNTQMLFDRIRKAFHTLYSNHEPLEQWAEQIGANTNTLPETGEYNIDDILKSPYFFG